uniref:C2H2-type domain-containing protein n=1 Tax=Meloidogyne enterolobii TaxID=390850 RepID=A0A6V7VHV6_MELEN|nr:unnamed protein product [Meloidogyne enterolobii]
MTKTAKRKAAKQALKTEQKKTLPSGPVACECHTCGEEFDSKSKLHIHLKQSGHAIIKSVINPPVTSGTNKKAEMKKSKKKLGLQHHNTKHTNNNKSPVNKIHTKKMRE